MKKQLIVLLLIALLSALLLVGCGESELSSVLVKKMPDKVEYEVGESFRVDGAKLEVTYSDGNVEEIDITSSMITSPVQFDSKGTKSIEITYTYGGVSKTATIVVNVKDTLGDARAIAIAEINGYVPMLPAEAGAEAVAVINTDMAAAFINSIREAAILRVNTARNVAEIQAAAEEAKAQIDGVVKGDKEATKAFLNGCVDSVIWNAPEGYPALTELPATGVTTENLDDYIAAKTAEMEALKAKYAAQIDAAVSSDAVMQIVAAALTEINGLPTYADQLAPYYAALIDMEFAEYDRWSPYISSYVGAAFGKIYYNNWLLGAKSLEELTARYEEALYYVLMIRTPIDEVVATLYDLTYPLVLPPDATIPTVYMMLLGDPLAPPAPDLTWDTYTIYQAYTDTYSYYQSILPADLLAELNAGLAAYDTARIPKEARAAMSDGLFETFYDVDTETGAAAVKDLDVVAFAAIVEARKNELLAARENANQAGGLNELIATAMNLMDDPTSTEAAQEAALEAAFDAYNTWLETYHIDEPNKQLAVGYVRMLYKAEIQALKEAIRALPDPVLLTTGDKALIDAARGISIQVVGDPSTGAQSYLDENEEEVICTIYKPEYAAYVAEDTDLLAGFETKLQTAEIRYAQLETAKANADLEEIGVNAKIAAIGDVTTLDLVTLKSAVEAARAEFTLWFTTYEIDDNENGTPDVEGASTDGNILLIVPNYNDLLTAETYYQNRVVEAKEQVDAVDTGLNARIDALQTTVLTDILELQSVEQAVAAWAETYGIVLTGENADAFHMEATGIHYEALCTARTNYNALYEAAVVAQTVANDAIAVLPATTTLADAEVMEAAITAFRNFVNGYLTTAEDLKDFDAYAAYLAAMEGFVSENEATATNLTVDADTLKPAYDKYVELITALEDLKAAIRAFAPDDKAVITTNNRTAILDARAAYEALIVANDGDPVSFMQEEYDLLLYAEDQLRRLDVNDAVDKATIAVNDKYDEYNRLLGENRANEGGKALYDTWRALQADLFALKAEYTADDIFERISKIKNSAEDAFKVAIQYLVTLNGDGSADLTIYVGGTYDVNLLLDVNGNHHTVFAQIVVDEDLVGEGTVELLNCATQSGWADGEWF